MSKKCQKSDDWLVIWSLSGRLVKRNTCHLLIRSLIAGIWTFGCRTSWSLVYVRLKIMHGIERIMAPSTHVCSLPDFYLGMDLHGKCEESCVDWKGWLKVLEAYTHHRAANQLQKPILRQIVDRLPFWTRSAQRLAWVVTFPLTWKATGDMFYGTARKEISVFGAIWSEHAAASTEASPVIEKQCLIVLSPVLLFTTHATSIRIKASRNVNK